jgi:hypothetical protein
MASAVPQVAEIKRPALAAEGCSRLTTPTLGHFSASCEVVPFYKARFTGYITITIDLPEQD